MRANRRRRRAVGALVVALAVSLLGGCNDKEQNATGPAAKPVSVERPRDYNVVLVGVDTLRADHLGCYGYERPTTPHTDALAQEGARFERCVAQSPWTLPSFMSILTSLRPSTHGVEEEDQALAADKTLLAELLSSKGWRCAGFFCTPYVGPAYGFGRGFEAFENCSQFDDWNCMHDPATDAEAVSEKALGWLRENRGQKFFLFVHYIDPHDPYDAPEPYKRKFCPPYSGRVDGSHETVDLMHKGLAFTRPEDLEHVEALYDGEIAEMDRGLGDLLAGLDELDVADDTLVVFTADHGEEFQDHGGMLHGYTLYDEQLLVPLIIRLPAGLRYPGVVVEEQVRLIDIVPTICEAVGVAPPPEAQGKSVLDLARGRNHRDHPRLACSETRMRGYLLKGARTSEAKFVYSLMGDERSLYDLEADPREQRNLIDDRPDEARQLEAAMYTAVPPFADDMWTLDIIGERGVPGLEGLLRLSSGRFVEVSTTLPANQIRTETPSGRPPTAPLFLGDAGSWLAFNTNCPGGHEHIRFRTDPPDATIEVTFVLNKQEDMGRAFGGREAVPLGHFGGRIDQSRDISGLYGRPDHEAKEPPVFFMWKGGSPEAQRIELDDELLEQLRGLGYID